jgi:excisionase family DNA binding protein
VKHVPTTGPILTASDDLGQIPSVLTSREVARVLRVGVREVRLLVDSGQLAGARVGPRKVIRISRVALLSLLKVREAI